MNGLDAGCEKMKGCSVLFKIRFAEAKDFTTDMVFFQPQLAEKFRSYGEK